MPRNLVQSFIFFKMEWEDYKKQAVFYENEIDKKLLNFSKLSVNPEGFSYNYNSQKFQ
jgi:hypothetical protein